jgi:hypothetical protein
LTISGTEKVHADKMGEQYLTEWKWHEQYLTELDVIKIP